MPKKINNSIPKLRHHKASGRAAVVLNGQWVYLGTYGTSEAEAAYERTIAEWLASGRRYVDANADDILISELIEAYYAHAEGYYIDSRTGRPLKELSSIRCAMRPLKKLYGVTPAAEFGPLALKTVQQAFIDADLCRSKVNEQVSRIKRLFKWSTANELIPPSVFHGLQTVDGLKRGRSNARESRKIKPVPDEYIRAALACVGRHISAMIRLQLLTGMRSGELVSMRPRDIDVTGRLWIYRPERHKTERFDVEREIFLGPQAQEIIKPFLKPNLDAYLFSPAEADAERRAALSESRATPLSCGNRPGSNRKRKPKRKPRSCYDAVTYRRAISRACDLANKAAIEERTKAGGKVEDGERLVPRWHPHQLRHNFGTMIRKQYGVEAARVLLGHTSVVTSEIYAERDTEVARRIAGGVG